MAIKHGNDSSEFIYGTDDEDETDYLYGHGGDDTIYGGRGFDYITGGAGADYIDGGSGGASAVYADSDAGVTVFLNPGLGFGGSAEGDVLVNISSLEGSDFDDVLSGNDNTNGLWGGFGNDTLKGGGGYDYLYGNEGDDMLWGGAGADRLYGGAGYDTASYEGSAAGVVVSLITNNASGGDAQGDTFQFIENLIGSDHADTLWGHNGANVLNGMGGNDTIHGFDADDTLRGEDGDDRLDGGIGADNIIGGAGHDILYGGTGIDTMTGGFGNDTYFVDSYADVIVESAGQGIDVVRTSVSYGLASGVDIESLETTDPNGTAPFQLLGNSSGNQIIGNNGHNIISGGAGVDQMIGRGGNDLYFVDNANDLVAENGGQGVDTVRTSVSWTLTAGADVEVLETTYLGNESINLTGNANGNAVFGNNGNNTLNGGDGRDDLTGRLGQDQFLFNTPLNAATNVDRVLDFNVADDTILLDNAVFSSSLGLGNISAGEFVIGTAAQDANDRIIYDSNTGALFYDNDGVGGNAQVQFAELSRGLALTNLDFLVVTGTQIPSGGTRSVFDGLATTDVAADDPMLGGRTFESSDLRRDVTQQDYLVW